MHVLLASCHSPYSITTTLIPRAKAITCETERRCSSQCVSFGGEGPEEARLALASTPSEGTAARGAAPAAALVAARCGFGDAPRTITTASPVASVVTCDPRAGRHKQHQHCLRAKQGRAGAERRGEAYGCRTVLCREHWHSICIGLVSGRSRQTLSRCIHDEQRDIGTAAARQCSGVPLSTGFPASTSPST